MTLTAIEVTALLRGFRFRGRSETDYQETIESIFKDREVAFEREVWLTPKDRIDFVLEGGLGIEVKVDDTRARIIRQLGRYAQSEKVSSLLLVSSRQTLVAGIPQEILGVSVRTLALRGAVL